MSSNIGVIIISKGKLISLISTCVYRKEITLSWFKEQQTYFSNSIFFLKNLFEYQFVENKN